MQVGFLLNQIDNRGTGNALYDYAHYNETILGNKSIIFTRGGPVDKLAEAKLIQRFGGVLPDIAIDSTIDVLYHIKSGEDDGYRAPEGMRYAVHAVFNEQPHGDRYAMVSNWLSNRGSNNLPYVPHIIDLPEHRVDIRSGVGLPKDAVVFGRYGGRDSFDISFAWDAIRNTIGSQPKVYFLFMNTDFPEDIEKYNGRIVSIEPTANPVFKRMFINSCDAMLHARSRGETFGISVGEFAVCNKPIITYGLSPEKAHLDLTKAYTYNSQQELEAILAANPWYWKGPWLEHVWGEGYKECYPEKVMRKFQEVFLS